MTFADSNTWAKIKEIVAQRGVSDIILEGDFLLTFVRHGETLQTDFTVPKGDFSLFLLALSRPVPQGLTSMDDAVVIESQRFRVSLFTHMGGVRAVLRLLITAIPKPQEINMPIQLQEAVDMHEGLILICGPNNSGKSTTIASFLQEVAAKRKGHIITVEDPIEFIHTDDKSIFSRRELGTHEPDYAQALKAALRQAPTHLVVGEIRDTESAEIALLGAETGRLVIATLHAGSVRYAIQRFLDLFPDEKLSFTRSVLAQALELLVVQHLIPVSNGTKRVAIHEVMRKNVAVVNCIRNAQWPNLESEVRFGQQRKQQSFEQSITAAEQRGLITHKEAEILLPRFTKSS